MDPELASPPPLQAWCSALPCAPLLLSLPLSRFAIFMRPLQPCTFPCLLQFPSSPSLVPFCWQHGRSRFRKRGTSVPLRSPYAEPSRTLTDCLLKRSHFGVAWLPCVVCSAPNEGPCLSCPVVSPPTRPHQVSLWHGRVFLAAARVVGSCH